MKSNFEFRYSFERKIFPKFVFNFDSLHRCYLPRMESISVFPFLEIRNEMEKKKLVIGSYNSWP